MQQTLAQVKRRALYLLQAFSCLALLVALTGPATLSGPLTGIALAIMLALLGFTLTAGAKTRNELKNRVQMLEDARQAQQQIEELFSMTDMLQAAEGHDDAGAVLMATSQRLLPGFSGALYVFNNSRDRLDLAASWKADEEFDPSATLIPSTCWALKRGKPHINDPASGTLRCHHHHQHFATVEVPMMARGSVHGLLILATGEAGGFDRLMKVRRLARALADSMSLALSNISLREKLHTQSLRDPLTGLYNRRYMEDALDRYISLAERTGGSTAVIMIDLDDFKCLNDVHGHAKGDAVLRDVAAQLLGGLRPSDVVSRYGGEELLVILPGCDLQDAMIKADILRARIEGLSEGHSANITASMGVAAIPETSTSAVDIVPMADAALYAAKLAGKNCIRTAELRAAKPGAKPRLAVAGRSAAR